MHAQVNTQPQEKIPADLSEFATKKGLVNEYPDILDMSALEWQLRFREENGLDEAVIKFGRKILIHKPTFLRWLMSRRGVAA